MQNISQEITVDSILSGTWAAVQQHAKICVIWLIALIATGVLVDQLSVEYAVGMSISFALVLYYGQSVITRRHLSSQNMISAEAASKTRLFSIFGNSILFSLAVALGLIMLIIPGIYLAARWWTSVPAMLSGEVSAMEGLGRSWDMTNEHFLAIGYVILILATPALISIPFYLYGSDENGDILVSLSLLNNALSSISYILLWLSSSVTYIMLKGGRSRLNEIFE